LSRVQAEKVTPAADAAAVNPAKLRDGKNPVDAGAASRMPYLKRARVTSMTGFKGFSKLRAQYMIKRNR
jgi:hypothetical protein